jgi:hypothetical protein
MVTLVRRNSFLEWTNGGYVSGLCIARIIYFLIYLMESSKENTKMKPKLMTNVATATSLMNGVALSGPHARTSHVHTS